MAAAKKHTLYWNPLCPFVHRSLIVMEEKGCADVPERVFIPLDRDAPEWYSKINPRETVPTLVVEGQPTLFESAFIAEYFDREFGTPDALLPTVPAVRAAIRDFQDVAGEMIGALYGTFFSEDSERAAAIEKAKARVAAVEAKVAEQAKVYGGPFFLGQQFSMADVAVVPFLQRFSATLPAFRAFDPFADAPHLRRMLDAAQLRPSVYRTSQTPAEYIRGYAAYGGKDAPSVNPKVRLNVASPFNQRVTVAAALAGLTVDVEAVTGEAATSERLPAVTIAGSTVRDSGKALSYLLESARTSESRVPPLTPADNVAFGRAQWVAQEADSLGSALVMSLKAGAGEDAAKELREAVAFTEAQVTGPWAVGAEPSWADAVLLPHLRRLQAAQPALLAGAPKLAGVLAAGEQNAAVKAALDAGAADAAAFDAFVKSA